MSQTEISNDNQQERDALLSEELQAKIPDYSATQGEQRAVLDEIISSVNYDDEETAADFAQDMLDELSTDMSNIDQEMMENREGAYASALDEFTEDMAELGIDEATEGVGDLVGAGAGYLKGLGKRNWKELAVAGGGLVAAPFTFGAGLAVTAGALGKLGYNEYKESTSDDAKMAELELRLQQSIKGIPKAVKGIKDQKSQIKGHRKLLDKLRKASENSVFNSTLHISAGREIARRNKEKILELEKDPIKNADALDRRRAFAVTFDRKMVMIESTYAMGAASIADVERRKTAMRNVEITFESIVGWETALIRSQAVQGSVALGQWQFAKSAKGFREMMQQNRKDTREITKKAEEASRDSRPDSPKLLAQFNEHLKNQISDQKEALTADQNFNKESRKERDKMIDNAQSLMGEHEKAVSTSAKQSADNVLEGVDTSTTRKRARAGGGVNTPGPS